MNFVNKEAPGFLLKIGPYVFSTVSFPVVAGVIVHGDAVKMTEAVVITAAEHRCAHLASMSLRLDGGQQGR